MKITVLTDSCESWFVPFGRALVDALQVEHDVSYVHSAEQIRAGDICFLLSCIRLLPHECLARNENNIVVHASDLPRGKGFSPLQWQILSGENDITLTLFEATEGADNGPAYFKRTVHFDGHELLGELRHSLGQAINAMCIDYVQKRATLVAIPQTGRETIYRRRSRKDDELDSSKSLRELFNQFRIADNDHHPLFFQHLGHRYLLKVYKDQSA